MNLGKLTIPVSLVCALLAGCASADTPAPAAAVTDGAAAGPDKAFLEDNPERLKAFTCQALDEAMASNYRLACFLETSANKFDKAVGDQSAGKFKAQHAEYKSRCNGAPAKLKEAKSHNRARCKSLPGA